MSQIKRILLVEDDPRDAELTLIALEKYQLSNGLDVVCDGEEALDYLYRRGNFRTRDDHNPAVVILDLKLPKISGLDVLRQIRADDKLKMVPVVVLTSSREEQDLITSYELGVNAYVVKPVDFPKFVEAVKTLGAFWVVFNESPLAN
jgi:DNA-binding response OmpR family regulator